MRKNFILSIISILFYCLLVLTGSTAYADDITNYSGADKSTITKDGAFNVNSQFGPRTYQGKTRNHEGLDLDIVGMEVLAPVDGQAQYNEGGGFGHYVLFLPDSKYDSERDDNTFNYSVGAVFVFGDLSEDTKSVGGFSQDGDIRHFKAGEPIGYIDSSSLQGNSDGPHLHFEYWIHGWKQGSIGEGSLQDPGHVLAWLGNVVGGYKPYAGNVQQSILSFDGFTETVGNFFSRLIDYFLKYSNAAYEHISPVAITFLTIMCILDLVLPILFAGMIISPFLLIRKCMKYAIFMGFVTYFPKFVNDGLWSFVNAADGLASGNAALIRANVCAPQLLLQKGMTFLSPMLNKLSHFGFYDTIRNLDVVVEVYLLTFVTIGFLTFFAVIVTLTIVEFYVSAGLCISTVPFGVFGLTKFVTEGALGHLVSSAFRYMFLCFFIFLSVTMIQDINPPTIFSGGKVSAMYPTQIGDYSPSASSGNTASSGNSSTSKTDDNKKPSTSTPSGGQSIEKIISDHPNAKYVVDAAIKYNMDPYICLTIMGQESTFGDNPKAGWNYMQIDPDQDVGVVPPGCDTKGMSPRYNIRALFTNLDNDPAQNCEAGVVMLYDKIASHNGNIVEGMIAYNGGGDPDYLLHISKIYQDLTGMPLANGMHMDVTTDQMWAFLSICVFLWFLVCLGYLASKHLTALLTGPIVIP